MLIKAIRNIYKCFTWKLDQFAGMWRDLPSSDAICNITNSTPIGSCCNSHRTQKKLHFFSSFILRINHCISVHSLVWMHFFLEPKFNILWKCHFIWQPDYNASIACGWNCIINNFQYVSIQFKWDGNFNSNPKWKIARNCFFFFQKLRRINNSFSTLFQSKN